MNYRLSANSMPADLLRRSISDYCETIEIKYRPNRNTNEHIQPEGRRKCVIKHVGACCGRRERLHFDIVTHTHRVTV